MLVDQAQQLVPKLIPPPTQALRPGGAVPVSPRALAEARTDLHQSASPELTPGIPYSTRRHWNNVFPALTLAPAYTAFQEKERGSIEPGKLAPVCRGVLYICRPA